jgi:CarD family transcriptional regulator
MYNIGDLVICGDSGVCRVEAIGKLDVPYIDRNRLYYTLSPIYRNGKIFVPTETKVFMRPVLTFSEAQRIIDLIPSIEEIDCLSSNHRVLKEHYNQLLLSHNCLDLIKLIKTIYTKNRINAQLGKQPGQIDIKFMKQAEDQLHGELAVALRIPREKVTGYIKNRVKVL